MTNEPTKDSNRCLLLRLPAKIRMTILRYALVEGRIEIYPSDLDKASLPSLLQVNHRIRLEAIDIYYKKKPLCLAYSRLRCQLLPEMDEVLSSSLDIEPACCSPRSPSMEELDSVA